MVEASPALLSLGGNIGDVVAAFAGALAALGRADKLRTIRRSSIWRTAPWGMLDQPDFLNMAVLVETTLEPRGLLDLCLAIERGAGRERARRWGPRTLDIDIVTYGERSLDEEGLTLPHPRAHERVFVLAPACEIAPDIVIGARTIREWLTGRGGGWAEAVADAAATARLEAMVQAARRG